MATLNPVRELPNTEHLSENDTVVIFGEVFDRGYVNGLIRAADKVGMKIVYATVGRRDENNQLRALTEEEVKEKNQEPLINVPLEAGFDLEPCGEDESPAEMVKGVKLKGWQDCKIDFDKIQLALNSSRERFNACVDQYLSELEELLPETGNVIFVHTMAGGVPRAKIYMPMLNRVFKGHGDRFLSSESFWSSDLGKLCAMNFEEVSAWTFNALVEKTAKLRGELEGAGRKVGYVAYGYHGTELYIDGEFRWQSYAPYLTGFAKLKLEEYATQASAKGLAAAVYNVPEILTNSSSMFQGIEVALYPLINAMLGIDDTSEKANQLILDAQGLLDDNHELHDIFDLTNDFFNSDLIKNQWSQWDNWPQHNGADQMALMRETSTKILEMHKDKNQLMTGLLSEIVFDACGTVMLAQALSNNQPVHWIGHDMVAKHYLGD